MSDTEDINIEDIKKIVNKMRNNSSIRKQVKKFQKETYENQDEEPNQEPQENLKTKDVKSKQKKPILKKEKKILDLTINDTEINNIINNTDKKISENIDTKLKTFLDILTKK